MYYSFRQFSFSLNPGVTTIQEDGYGKQIVSISTKHGDIKVFSHGRSTQETGMQGDFSFSYLRGIPSPIYQGLIRFLTLLERRSQSKSTEPIEYGSETENHGGNGVQERIAAYTNRSYDPASDIKRFVEIWSVPENANVDAVGESTLDEVMQDFMTMPVESDFLDEVEKELGAIGRKILGLRLRMARYNVTP